MRARPYPSFESVRLLTTWVETNGSDPTWFSKPGRESIGRVHDIGTYRQLNESYMSNKLKSVFKWETQFNTTQQPSKHFSLLLLAKPFRRAI